MKKIISIMLSAAILTSCVPVFAVEDIELPQSVQNLLTNQEYIEEEEIAEPIEIGEVPYVEPEETEEVEEEPTIHEEIVKGDFKLPEETNAPESDRGSEEISVMSISDDDSTLWKSILAKAFGNSYLKPFEKRDDGQTVSGNTNRLVIEETDLTLAGKNGLDLVLKRRYDNQDYNNVYYADNSFVNVKRDRYLYGFTNIDTNETIYIGFLSVDQLYTYLYDGFRLNTLYESWLKTYTDKNGNVYRYYTFETIFSQLTDDTSCDRYEYNQNISPKPVHEDINNDISLEWQKVKSRKNGLGDGWYMLIPEAYIYRSYCNSGSDEYGKWADEEYVGSFTDIDGNVHMFTGFGGYDKDHDSDSFKYTLSYSCEDNSYLHFRGMYIPEKLNETGPEYNFVASDSRGLKYYMYNTGLVYGELTKPRYYIYIVAIEDEYGNTITYEYEKDADGNIDYTKLKKIIDTYGREINFNSVTGGKQISYYNDVTEKTETITYTSEELPASALDNDSPIKPKAVHRFTVTNQEGESTVYDSRNAESINYYSNGNCDINGISSPGSFTTYNAEAYNIERIQYPTGAETRYRYKCLNQINTVTDVCSGVYAVEESYDLVDGEITGQKEYSFANPDKGMEITKTCMDNSKASKTVTEYNSDGLEKNVTIKPQTGSAPYKEIDYKYDDNKKPEEVTTKENGMSSKMTYSYSGSYPDRLLSVSNGIYEISYSYHTSGDKIKEISYKDITGWRTKEDYRIVYDLTSDGKEIEYEKVVQDDTIKAQTKYAYDSEGNVSSIKQWTNDTNSDGVLDDNDDVTELKSYYNNQTEQKTGIVLNHVMDVLNADGDNEGDVQYKYEYNIYGSPLWQENSYGIRTTVEYDGLNRPVKYTMPNGGVRTVEYNATENYSLVTDEAGIVTKFEFDGLGRDIAKYVKEGSKYNKLEEYTYDDAGRIATKTSYRDAQNSIVEQYTYDIFDRVTQKKVYDSSKWLYTEEYTYSNTRSEAQTVKTVSASGASLAQEKSYYNVYGLLTKTESISEDTVLTNAYEYDYQGRVVKETDPNGNETAYEYGYDGQVTKQTNANGDSVSTVYDMAGQVVSVTDAKGNTANTYYDKLGRVIKEVTPFSDTANGETKTYYDKNSNVVKTAVKRSGSVYQTKEYKYDNMGNMIADISNNDSSDIVTQYSYDTANRMTEMITGLEEYSENPTGGAKTEYSYNSQGYIYQITDPMGNKETYSNYDYAGNALTITDRNSNTMHNVYGAYGLIKTYFSGSPETKEYTYNNIGQLVGTKAVNANEESVEESYNYDDFGRLISMTSNDGTEQSYTYDSNSNVLSYTMAKDNTERNSVEYEYNGLNQLTELSNNDIITSYEYDANGNLTKKTQNNGLTTDYSYNNAGLMTETKTKKGGSVYTYAECTYLQNGLLHMLTMPDEEYSGTRSKTKQYTYDKTGRLLYEQENGNDYLTIGNQYWYDSYGNRTMELYFNLETDEHVTTEYEYDLNNRLVSESIDDFDSESTTHNYSSVKYYYDKNGNMTARQGINRELLENEASLAGRSADTGLELYRYDAFNRLSKYYSGSTEASYTYSADNLRHDKVVNNNRTEYVWNGQNLASETSGENINTYTYDATGVYIANQNGTVSSYLKDNHGNVIGKTDATGTMMQAASELKGYDAYGNLRTGAAPDPFGYCGEYYDNETGLIYLRNRYYDSTKGIFLTEDPAKDGLNWYSYCNGNPVNAWDPLGLFVNGDQYLTPEHVGQILLSTLVYYAGEKLNNPNIKTYASNAAEWYRTNDSKNSYHLGLGILYSYNSEANGVGVTLALFEGLDNMFSFSGDALDTIAQGLFGEVPGTVISSVVGGLQNDVTPKDELYNFWREVQYVQDLSFKNYNTQCSFEIITDANGSYIRMTYYNEDRLKIEKDFMKQTFYAVVANAVVA